MIYHITTEMPGSPLRKASTTPESLKTEGFIHCSDHFSWKVQPTAFTIKRPT